MKNVLIIKSNLLILLWFVSFLLFMNFEGKVVNPQNASERKVTLFDKYDHLNCDAINFMVC